MLCVDHVGKQRNWGHSAGSCVCGFSESNEPEDYGAHGRRAVVWEVRLNADDLNVDAITIVGHKIGAPKGIAALYCEKVFSLRKDDSNGGADPYRSFLKGGGQEGGKRAGTETCFTSSV